MDAGKDRVLIAGPAKQTTNLLDKGNPVVGGEVYATIGGEDTTLGAIDRLGQVNVLAGSALTCIQLVGVEADGVNPVARVKQTVGRVHRAPGEMGLAVGLDRAFDLHQRPVGQVKVKDGDHLGLFESD